MLCVEWAYFEDLRNGCQDRKRALQEMEDAGILIRSGGTTNRRIRVKSDPSTWDKSDPSTWDKSDPIREEIEEKSVRREKREEELGPNMSLVDSVPFLPGRDEGNRSEKSKRTKYSEVAERARAKLRQTNQAASENETAWTVQEETQRFRVVAG